MSKKFMSVLSVCLLLGAGIAVAVWASCCPAAPICGGGAAKMVGDGCNYEFTVNINDDCVTGATVKLYIEESGGAGWFAYMMQLTGVQTPCAHYYVPLYGLHSGVRYNYYFTVQGSCSGQDPADPVRYALVPLCN